MAKRKIEIGLMSYVRADTPEDTVLWGFGLNGAEVDVHESDLERFDRFNSPAAPNPPPPPLVVDEQPDESEEPPRSGKGSGLDAWTAHAESLGLLVDEGSSRDEIIALVDASK